MNFDFLKREDGYYDLFADACLQAENVFNTSPEMSVIGCRKAMELAVKWVYAADSTINAPYRDNLSSLIHEETFVNAIGDSSILGTLKLINKMGNVAVHTKTKIKRHDAIVALRGLFVFIDWIDYCYGPDYVERSFDETKLPSKSETLTKERENEIRSQQSLIDEHAEVIKQQQAQIAEMQAELEAQKKLNKESRNFNPEKITEFTTRKLYVDFDLRLAGWKIGTDAIEERPVLGMPNVTGEGFIDYLLLGKDDKPLAIVEAKRTMLSHDKGLQQARLYADCLEKEYGYKPPIFLTNGFETTFVDDGYAVPRRVSSVFSQDDLQRLMNRRKEALTLANVSERIDHDIAGRYYQIRAIEKVAEGVDYGQRKFLLVMATGTGKTRVSAVLVKTLMSAGYVKNVLFLADRVALVSQAKYAYSQYLPNETLCNLCENKDDRNARIVFSTYPTILNAIDSVKNEDGVRMYSPAHFDLIIIDEAHRSIFKKYKYIFDYFDAMLVGLTATPADMVHRNTYDFFGLERGVPTDLYEYETAVADGYLVDYLGISTHTDFLDEGIKYDELPEDEQEKLDDAFEEAGEETPDEILSTEINRWVFNEQTVDNVLVTLMEQGIRVDGGQLLGKTIIFAANKEHAKYIVERFGALYPKDAMEGYIRRIVHGEDYSHSLIDDFKNNTKPMPRIAVSVDMMDTGIDVPEVVNLVFFKRVKSKIKFMQMIGRGTRICENLDVVDALDNSCSGGQSPDKKRFYIFDWCRNFEYFNQGGKEVDGKLGISLDEDIFAKRADLSAKFQTVEYIDEEWQNWRNELVDTMHYQVVSLNDEHVSVRLERPSVEKFKNKEAFTFISDSDLHTLKRHIAPLVRSGDKDSYALRFDSLMYGFIFSLCDELEINSYKRKLINIATQLQEKITIPHIREKIDIINKVTKEDFYEDICALDLEDVRHELRELIQFLKDDNKRSIIYTDLADPVTGIEFAEFEFQEDYTSYKQKVEYYLEAHKSDEVVQKLLNNRPISNRELKHLERVLIHELGSNKDYEDAYGDISFGILVRKILHMDRSAAAEAFSEFLQDNSMNSNQIDFINKIIDYIVTNGIIETADLMRAPFDRPQSWIKLFNERDQLRHSAQASGNLIIHQWATQV